MIDQEARTRFICITVMVGRPEDPNRYSATITPASEIGGHAAPTLCQITASSTNVDALCAALTALDLEHTVNKSAAGPLIEVYLGHTAATRALELVSRLLFKKPAAVPKYWFGLCSDPDQELEECIILRPSGRTVEMQQPQRDANGNQSTPFLPNFWVGLQEELRRSELCTSVYVAYDASPLPYIRVELTEAAHADLENTLLALARLAPATNAS